MEYALFFAFSLVAIVSGIMVITQKNAVYSGLYLLLTFFCLAALYILLHAEFVAVVQIAVYAGAIIVLFLFVIMLLNLRFESDSFAPPLPRMIGIGVGLLFAVQFVWIGLGGMGAAAERNIPEGTTAALGMELFTKYIVPFEAAGVLLLVAMLGAVYLAKRKHN